MQLSHVPDIRNFAGHVQQMKRLAWSGGWTTVSDREVSTESRLLRGYWEP